MIPLFNSERDSMKLFEFASLLARGAAAAEVMDIVRMGHQSTQEARWCAGAQLGTMVQQTSMASKNSYRRQWVASASDTWSEHSPTQTRKVDDVPVAPYIWTDGSREPIPHLDVEVAVAGAFVHSPAIIFDSNHWGCAQDPDDPQEGSSHIFSGVLGPIQSVQRAEYWGVILALQAYSGIHLGIDNLNVLHGVAALLSQGVTRTPLPLVKDGDLLAIFITRETCQGRGGGERVELHGRGPEDSSSPAGALQPVRRRARRGNRSGSRGTPWSLLSTSSALLPWCRSSTLLCRRRWNSCQTSSVSSTRSCLIPSRLSKCPRSCLMMSLCERLRAIRSWRSAGHSSYARSAVLEQGWLCTTVAHGSDSAEQLRPPTRSSTSLVQNSGSASDSVIDRAQ